MTVVLAGGLGLLLLLPRVAPGGDVATVDVEPAASVRGEARIETVGCRQAEVQDRAEVIQSWPVADAGREPQAESGRVRAPRTEKEWQRHFVGLFRTDPTLGRDAMVAAMAGHHPLAMRIAALRVSYDVGGQERLALLRQALATGGDGDLRSFAVHFLGAHCAADAESRDELTGYLRARPEDAGLRGHAVYSVMRWGTMDQVQCVLDGLSMERDLGVMSRAAGALRERDERAMVPMVDGLLRRAASPEVRHRLQEEITGAFCPEHAPVLQSGR